jgi:hypothetical protein
MMMSVVERTLRQTCAVALVAGTFGIAASAALADQAWTPPAPDSYPTGWDVKSTPEPQAYDYKVGTGTMELKATGRVPPPTTQNAQVIYEMVPGGLRYHRIIQ